jgi:protein-tyrosine phosphatase
MPPLADTHVHLLAGLDDGPDTPDIALAMCRKLVSEGAVYATALAHQNRDYPENTADQLRTSATALSKMLAEKKLPLSVHPTGEIMLLPETLDDWFAGRLLSVGDHRQWLLVEMPHSGTINVLPFVEAIKPEGLGCIIAHAERYPELLDDLSITQKWIEAGCLIQVTARSLADPWNAQFEESLKRWAKSGFIHLIGSDGHGIDRRRPELAAGYKRLAKWVGRSHATQIASVWGAAVLQGRPLKVPPLLPNSRSWFSRLFGG